MTLAAGSSYPFLDLMWSMFLFFGLIVWFWLLITVFADLFRRDDIGGWGKTGWTVFVIVLPLIGAFTYLLTQSHAMAQRDARQAETLRRETDAYIRSVVASDSGTTDQIARAKELLDNGAISQDEYEALKKRALV